VVRLLWSGSVSWMPSISSDPRVSESNAVPMANASPPLIHSIPGTKYTSGNNSEFYFLVSENLQARK
jgi:hypothetical protein